MPILIEKFDLGAIFDFLDFQKGTFGTSFSVQKPSFVTRRVQGKRPCRDPVFHETTIMTVPLGPTVFKRSFVCPRLNHFRLVSVFLCPICYPTFLSPIVHNTTVNVQPLNPPLFEKTAPHLKTHIFLLWFNAFAFFKLLILL